MLQQKSFKKQLLITQQKKIIQRLRKENTSITILRKKLLRNEAKIKRQKNELQFQCESNASLILKSKNCCANTVKETLKEKGFTKAQIKLIMHPLQDMTSWDSTDISRALVLRALGPKAYSYIQSEKIYPLPGISTLRR